MIREAELRDMHQLVELAKYFVPRIGYASLSEAKFRPAMNQLIKSPHAIVLVAENEEGELVGVLIAQCMRIWYSDDYYATDLGFVVKPEHSGVYAWLMAKRFIRWAKAQPRVVDITMQISSGLDEGNRIGQMYEALGLKRMGGCYTMSVEKKS